MLEAMASGLAIVSADVPSARALLAPGRSGLLVSPDPADYAAAIASLIEDEGRLCALGEAAREASAAFSWAAESASVEQAYRMLLTRRSETRPV
jgi:phosphatidylinositol alpha 1,6-mannosyltransferase